MPGYTNDDDVSEGRPGRGVLALGDVGRTDEAAYESLCEGWQLLRRPDQDGGNGLPDRLHTIDGSSAAWKRVREVRRAIYSHAKRTCPVYVLPRGEAFLWPRSSRICLL